MSRRRKPPEENGAAPAPRLHLIKLSVGSDSIESLSRWQQGHRRHKGRVYHRTRMMPKRAEEIAGQGSIFWVIRGLVRCRQRILAFERVADEEGRPATRIWLDPPLVPTWPQPWRAFQGWRYLAPEEAPPDLERALGRVEGDVAEMPAEMLVELRELGLL